MHLRFVAILALVCTALAGCSDGPESGALTAIPGTISVDGSTTENTYQAAVTPASDASNGAVQLCTPDAVPEGTPGADDFRCQDAFTSFKVHVMTLPEPDGNGYSVYYAGGEFDGRQVGTMLNDGTGMYVLDKEFPGEDQSGKFDDLQVRMNDFVVATASGAQGSQAFVANSELTAVTVTGTYSGRTLTLQVAGLPEGDGFIGRLYKPSQTGNLTVAETFPVNNGAVEFESEKANIGDYTEFHIHVGDSKIYLYQGTLE